MVRNAMNASEKGHEIMDESFKIEKRLEEDFEKYFGGEDSLPASVGIPKDSVIRSATFRIKPDLDGKVSPRGTIRLKISPPAKEGESRPTPHKTSKRQ